MITTVDTGPTLQMRRLISSIWLVLRKNFLLILMLSVALKFLTSNLATFLESEWLMTVIGLIVTNGETEDAVKIVIGYLQWMLYWMLLTIFITRTSFDTLSNPQRRILIPALLSHALKHMKNLYTAAGMRMLIRCIGVVAVTYAGLLLIPMVLFLVVWLFDLSTDSIIVMGAVLWVLSFLALSFLTVRLSMAMPEVIIRKAGVLESLTGSWILTRRLWIKMLGISLLFSFVVVAIVFFLLVVILAVMYFQNTDVMALENFETSLLIVEPIFEVVWISIMAIWITAQYYVITNEN